MKLLIVFVLVVIPVSISHGICRLPNKLIIINDKFARFEGSWVLRKGVEIDWAAENVVSFECRREQAKCTGAMAQKIGEAMHLTLHTYRITQWDNHGIHAEITPKNYIHINFKTKEIILSDNTPSRKFPVHSSLEDGYIACEWVKNWENTHKSELDP